MTEIPPSTPVETLKPGGFGPLFANRSFFVMWLGQVFSQTADKLVFILLVEIVGELSASPTVMSSALAIQASPSVLLGAAAGVLVDRLDKRRVMIVTNVMRAVLVVGLGVWGHVHVVVAVALAFGISSCAQPFIPAEGAAMPLVVKREQLLQANSLFATTMIGSIIVAFTLGQPIVQLVGTRNAAWVVGAGFMISVVFLYFVRYEKQDMRAARKETFWQQLKDGFNYVRRTPAIRNTILQQTAIFGMFAAMSVLAIILAKTILHVNFSWFLATAGAGMGLGAWVLGHFGHTWNKNRVVVGGFFASGLVLAALAAIDASYVIPAFVIAFLLGTASSLVAVPLQTRLQELVTEELRGKVFGAQNMLLNIATTLPIAAAGFLVDAIGLRWVLSLVAALMFAAALLSWRTFRRPAQRTVGAGG